MCIKIDVDQENIFFNLFQAFINSNNNSNRAANACRANQKTGTRWELFRRFWELRIRCRKKFPKHPGLSCLTQDELRPLQKAGQFLMNKVLCKCSKTVKTWSPNNWPTCENVQMNQLIEVYI